jgi:hypothetical protein
LPAGQASWRCHRRRGACSAGGLSCSLCVLASATIVSVHPQYAWCGRPQLIGHRGGCP